jgi:uncharacterized protein YfdQ (DUF2303 family)
VIDVKQILQAGADGAGAACRVLEAKHPSDPSVAVPVVLDTPGSSVRLAKDVLDALDARRPGPLRPEGTTQLTEVDSFIAYLARWGTQQAVIYADTAALKLTAVLDEHPSGATETAWRKRRAVYSCPRAAEWIAWTGQADKPMGQTAFGDWIETRLEDLVAAEGLPKPTEMLTVARQLHIKTSGEFRRDINPTNGDSILINKSETTPGSTQIPRAFMVGIPCFEGGDRYQLEARLRFSLEEGGKPMFTFTLHRCKEIERDAFGEVRSKVAKETTMLVLAGTP